MGVVGHDVLPLSICQVIKKCPTRRHSQLPLLSAADISVALCWLGTICDWLRSMAVGLFCASCETAGGGTWEAREVRREKGESAGTSRYATPPFVLSHLTLRTSRPPRLPLEKIPPLLINTHLSNLCLTSLPQTVFHTSSIITGLRTGTTPFALPVVNCLGDGGPSNRVSPASFTPAAYQYFIVSQVRLK